MYSSAIYENDSGGTDLALLTILLENASLTSLNKNSKVIIVRYKIIFVEVL